MLFYIISKIFATNMNSLKIFFSNNKNNITLSRKFYFYFMFVRVPTYYLYIRSFAYAVKIGELNCHLH